MILVPRTCTLVGERDGEERLEGRSQNLAELREVPAYVLLGEPGAGKTTAFEQEADESSGRYITARRLLTFDVADHPEWRDVVLFIDGLDEVRAGSADARTPFDEIRKKLDALRPPGFRLSCRAADWLGAGDRADLEEAAPGGKVVVLHLDPLTDGDVLAILKVDSRVRDAPAFVEQAERRGLGGLLPNPKTLDLLVEAVDGERWPSTRRETFELACSKLVREHNREHLAARRADRPVEDLLKEAGALCAVLLLSGRAGYTLSIQASGDDLVHLADVPLDAIRPSGDGLRSKLFVWPQEVAQPVHRTVAEYLGARYLADCVERAGLPVGRLLALMTGSDGGIVSELRGLAAWAATMSASAGAEIIERDPVAVTLYGDLGELNNAAHERLLSALRREMERYPYIPSRGRRPHSSLAALSTAQLEPTLQGILESTDRGETQQALAKLVGEILTEGEPRPRLRECLLRAVRDSSWWPIVRFRALEAVIQIGSVAPDSSDQLEALMAEIQRGELSDPDDALESRLLATLYPDRIPATKLLDYLHAPRRPHNLGPFFGFWLSTLFKRASASDLATLLDGLAERRPALRETVDESLLLRRFAGTLLARTLMTRKSPIEAPRLFAWLGVGLDRYDRIEGVDRDQLESIRAWLTAHPDAYKAVFAYGLTHLPDGEWVGGEVRRLLSNRLYGAAPPADFAASCLELAADTENETLARVLFRVAVEAVTDENTQTALSREELEAWVAEHAFAESWLREALAPPPWREEQERQERDRQAKATEEQRERQRAVREHEHELREGRASLGLLEYLAATYFDLFAEVKGDTPRERLVWLLGDDPGLVESAVIGLQSSIDRQDIPDVQEVLRLDAENKRHRMSLPFLAGLEETTPDELERLGDDRWRLAVALQLTQEGVLQHGLGRDPLWIEGLRTEKPGLVADVLVDYARMQIRGGKTHVAGIRQLARDHQHAGVARKAALRLLRVFPVRCKTDVLGNLKYLLQAAMRYADVEELLALIGTKLTRLGMDVAQRAYWLGAGLLLDPDAYVDQVEAYAGVTEVRVRHLAAFLALDTFEYTRDRRGWPPLHELTTEALRLLIRLIGESYGPMALEGGAHWSGPADDAADLVQLLIDTVGERTGSDATRALEDMVADPAVSRWRHPLRAAAHRQRALARDASFRRADVAEVVRTLRNEQPANVADLAALTLDVLRDLAKEIRHSATDDYLQLWNETPRRKPTRPKHEDACRDALLSKLESRLRRLDVGAQPEGHYAEDKRADVRVTSSGFNVPIEIKKNSHRDLWHAIHTQLIAKYTRDPGAGGFGIYVVLWFGARLTTNPREGGKPRSPAELEQRLDYTLSTEEARRISVCVIDASVPAREASTNR